MFTQFPDLPPELRNSIWQLALPNEIKPGVLFQFRRGCWGPLHLTDSHPAYDPTTPDENIALEFFPERLGPISTRTSLLLVNREAHGICLSWIQELGLKVYFSHEEQRHILTRCFKRDHDILYISPTQLNDFAVDPLDRQAEPDLMERIILGGDGLTQVAVPASLLEREPTALEEIQECFPRLQLVFVVLNAPDEIAAEETWEIREQGKALVHSAERGQFEWGEGESLCEEAVYRHIEEVGRRLTLALSSDFNEGFELRPVAVVKRGSKISKLLG
ncbi:2EXR domain-containing protein [Aspergillus homomorphus CBS 101889]|uniref:2EXR domain-containing protein n=1 Tax=Aspergillus homomorphus (strain CBS 101889) TaxID=1450537 RepID=A0A395HS76_ASPHC|nr:hypothetical protein BO97DRAFT_407104 [Aspergillus homomorphus CBS 101889]RAL10195.1 hypothetical protein BO97DRAFT_407104 [Aspergillus homomorphus CBS 101889]